MMYSTMFSLGSPERSRLTLGLTCVTVVRRLPHSDQASMGSARGKAGILHSCAMAESMKFPSAE